MLMMDFIFAYFFAASQIQKKVAYIKV